MSGSSVEQRHVAFFDANVYLDIAELIGPPFTWPRLERTVAQEARQPVPHPRGRQYDSLKAVAVCLSGRFVGPETLEVWSNPHLSRTVEWKAQEAVEPDPVTGYRGLGWSADDARALVHELVDGLVSRSAGGHLGDHYPDSNPPLDHEDGMIYGACRELAGEDPLCRVYCVTNDGGFLRAYDNGKLTGYARVLSPVAFVSLVRKARTVYSTGKMAPK